MMKLNVLTKKNQIYLSAILLVAFIVGISNYIRMPIATLSDGFAYFIHGIILVSSVFGVLYFLSINKYVFGVLFPIFFVISLLSAYFLYVYNITITAGVIDVLLNTDWYLSLEFVSTEMLTGIGIVIIVLSVFIIYRLKSKELFSRSYGVHLLLSLLLILPSIVVNGLRANTIINRVPYTIIGASEEYLRLSKLNSMPRNKVGVDAVSMSNDSLLVVLILGESVRNDHLGFNGYRRETTPNLRNDSIIPFPKTRSLATYTAASVPQLLTRADVQSPLAAFKEESFISILKRCCFSTSWLANQTPDYTYDGLVKEAERYHNVSITSSSYSDKKWTDELILPVFREELNDLGLRHFVGLHAIGSHWYYNYRCSDSIIKFKPVTESRSISHNSKEAIINSYDNSILFMDYFVSKVISMISDKNAILIYISDHGELLGEDDMWLHASDHEVLFNAACFLWMSEKYKRLNPDKYSAALENKDSSFTTSLLFHTVLGACDIRTSVLIEAQNILSQVDNTKTNI